MPDFCCKRSWRSKWNIAPAQKMKVEEFPNLGRGGICWAIKKKLRKYPVLFSGITDVAKWPKSWPFTWRLFTTEYIDFPVFLIIANHL